jgi:hypothetical protein
MLFLFRQTFFTSLAGFAGSVVATARRATGLRDRLAAPLVTAMPLRSRPLQHTRQHDLACSANTGMILPS